MSDNSNTLVVHEATQDEVRRWEYAKFISGQTLKDPNGTAARQSQVYKTYTRDEIDRMLSSPGKNEKKLRDASIYMYQVNSRYRNLISYYANIPCWYHVIYPVGFNEAKGKKANFPKQYEKVCKLIESMGIKTLMPEVCKTVLREGAFYGVIWGGDGSSFLLQKLNPDNCAIVSLTDNNVFRFAYDMSTVKPETIKEYFPPEFEEMLRDYQRTKVKYQLVPQDISFCVKADPTVLEYSIPPFSALIPSLYSIKNIEDLSEASAELSNYKLLAGVMQTDEDGVPKLDEETAMMYYNLLAANVGDRVGVAITPFELKDYSFEKSGNTSQVDEVSRANENFFSAAGTSASLHGTTNTTSGVMKMAVKADEGNAFNLVGQCQNAINRYLREVSHSIQFKLEFLPVTVFNKNEMVDQYKSALNFGVGKLQYLAVNDINQYDVLGQTFIESNILGIDDLLTPLKTAATRSAQDEKSPGRPLASDEDLGDAGEVTRDAGSNEDR